MWNVVGEIFKLIGQLALWVTIPVAIALYVFLIVCKIWGIILQVKDGIVPQYSNNVPPKRDSLIKQIFVLVPRRYMLDKYTKEPDYFEPRGIHMFCGEQGCGKTISCVEMMLRLQKQYPKSKMISNFGVTTETDPLEKWEQLLEYNNGHQGVIVGIDEIQNWFMSGLNKLPEGMLEVVTQNRKHNRILCCTAQVFTRVNKGIREQVTLVYEPHTFLGCFTIVFKRKPEFDSEGNVTKRKFRGAYFFTHTDELRAAYDTYKAIHILAKEGFKEQAVAPVTNVYVATAKGK